MQLFKKYLDVNQALTVRKPLLHETHEGFLIIRKPFTMMLGFIELFPPGCGGGGVTPLYKPDSYV